MLFFGVISSISPALNYLIIIGKLYLWDCRRNWSSSQCQEPMTRSLQLQYYNPDQNSCFSPSPHYNVDFSRSPKSRSVHRSLACFNIVWGEGGRKTGSERRTNVAHITMEACTVNSLLFAQNLTSVPKCFDPDCRSM